MSLCHDGGHLPLLGKQEPLEFPHPQGRVGGQTVAASGGSLDLPGDRVEPPSALAHRGVDVGKQLRQGAVGLGDGGLLVCQLRLPRAKGGYRVTRHTGRRIAMLAPSGLIRTDAPGWGASTTRLLPIASCTCPACGKTRSPGRTCDLGTGMPSYIC